MPTPWSDDPLSKAVPCKAWHIHELRAAIEAAIPNATVPWGRGNRVGTSINIRAQDLLDLRTGIGQVWAAHGTGAGPMLWTESMPGMGTRGRILRASHVDDLRRWFNTSETGAASYQFPRVRPLLFGINPSWVEVYTNPNHPAQFTNAAMMAKIRAAGATCVRAGIDWACIEPAPPDGGGHHYYWDATQAPPAVRCANARNYDADVQLALQNGLAYVAVVGTAPDWATGNSSRQMPPSAAHEADFQAFVTAMAQHYLGQIHHYEFNNEPDSGIAWNNPDPMTYVHFLQQFYNAIKGVDPSAWVSTGGVTNLTTSQRNVGLNFIEAIYGNGGRPYFDAVAAHPYGPNNGPFDSGGVQNLRNFMAGPSIGDTYKPIWLTEYGWAVASPSCGGGLDPSTQSSYLQQAFTFLTNATYNYVTIATFQIIADIPTGTCMGLLDETLDSTVRSAPAYGTFASQPKPTT